MGWLFGLLHLVVVVAVGWKLARRFLKLENALNLTSAACLLGPVCCGSLTFVLALLFREARDPLAYANTVFYALAFTFLFLTPRASHGAPHEGSDADRDGRRDWIVAAALLVLVTALLAGSLRMQGPLALMPNLMWTDLGLHVGTIRGFSLGHNYPPQNPQFAGAPFTYHYLFYFFCANLEWHGFPLVSALNLPSILTLWAALVQIAMLGKTLFPGSWAGWIAAPLPLFRGSLAFVRYFQSAPSWSEGLRRIFAGTEFITSGFPYYEADWGWTIDVWTNQRHLACGIGLFLLVVGFLLRDRMENRPVPRGSPWFSGIMIGLLPFWHGSVFLSAIAVLSMLWALFPHRKHTFWLLVTACVVAAPQLWVLKTIGSGFKGYPAFHWGYIVWRPALWNVASYLGFQIGWKWILLIVAALALGWRHRAVLLATSAPLALALCVQFAPQLAVNHKFFNIWLVFANLFAAWALIAVWRQAWSGKVLAVMLGLGMTFTGAADFLVLKNDFVRDFSPSNDPVARWITQNTRTDDVFLTNPTPLHPVLLAGRRMFLGYLGNVVPAGLPGFERLKIVEAVYKGSDAGKVRRLLSENGISYFFVDSWTRSDQPTMRPDEAFFDRNFDVAFRDESPRYGSLKIYRVARKTR
ncbi:MAG: hypothetical protein V1798_06445 [Pseudomonadota bacterium]